MSDIQLPDCSSAVPSAVECCADWDISLTRYFFVDNENGADSNVGYIDSAPGTIFGAGVGAAVALKTREELSRRIPRIGAGRSLVVLFKTRVAGGIAYLNKAGNPDFYDSEYQGYDISSIFRASTDLTNSLQDRQDLGGSPDATAVGPDAGGRWTLAGAGAGFKLTVSSGVLPTQTQLAGLKLQFDGNITAGLELQSRGAVKRVSDTELDLMRTVPVAAANDTFRFMRPGLSFTTWEGTLGQNGPQSAGVFIRGTVVGGFEFTASTFPKINGDIVPVFLRFAANSGFSLYGAISCLSTYRDETDTSRTIGLCIDAHGSFSVFGGVSPNISTAQAVKYSAFHSTFTWFRPTSPSLIVGGGCAFIGLASVGVAQATSFLLAQTTPQSSIFGDLTGGDHPACVFAGATLTGSISIGFVSLEASTATITLRGIKNAVFVSDLTGTCAAGVSVITLASLSSDLICDQASITATPGAGGSDISMQGGIVATFASLAVSPQIDGQGNVSQGTTGAPIRKTVRLFSGGHDGQAGAVVNYLADRGAIAVAGGALVNAINYPMPASRVRNLRAKASTNSLAAAVTVEIYKNGVATGVTVTIPAGSLALQTDIANEAQFAAGDVLDVRTDSNAAGAPNMADIAGTFDVY